MSKKKEKVRYIDDGSTVADMRGTRRGDPDRPRSTAKEKARTFFQVFKKMLLPCLITLIAFTLVFVIFLALAGKF